MTDDAQAHHTPSDLSPSGDRAGGFAGVLPSEGHESHVVARDPLPLIVGQDHGILTGESSPTWPIFGSGWFAENFPGRIRTVNAQYFEWPLPRFAAIRNRGRSLELSRAMIRERALLEVECGCQPEFAHVGHSNGGVLAMQKARLQIARGIPIRAIVLIAPALRTRDTTREIVGWMERGMLDYALLVRPMRDAVIGLVGRSWRTKIVSWPWGSLGDDGWDPDEIDYRSPYEIQTLDLPDMGHSDPVAPANREWLYWQIIAPALGLAPWDTLAPRGGMAA